MIPEYINCDNKYITDCEFFMHNDCPRTCALYTYLGIGSNDPETQSRLEKEINDSQKGQEMKGFK